MILLYGLGHETPIQMIGNSLEELNQDFFTVNINSLENTDIHLEYNGDLLLGEVSVGNKSYSIKDISGIYNRSVDLSLFPEFQHVDVGDNSKIILKAKSELFNNLLEWKGIRVLNPNRPMVSNSSKLYQMMIIQKCGFLIPNSIITNKIEKLNAFRRNFQQVIFKSASGVRSIVKKLDDSYDMQNILNCPTLFQKCLEGSNIRVHVVGDDVFATEIVSDGIDYRYSNRENFKTDLREIKLDSDIQKKCIKLSQILQLPLAGIDLFKSKDNRWYCFEVNPSPGFSYYENHTDQPISMSIAKYLANLN